MEAEVSTDSAVLCSCWTGGKSLQYQIKEVQNGVAAYSSDSSVGPNLPFTGGNCVVYERNRYT